MGDKRNCVAVLFFCNLDKCIWQLGQMHFEIQTILFRHLDKYISTFVPVNGRPNEYYKKDMIWQFSCTNCQLGKMPDIFYYGNFLLWEFSNSPFWFGASLSTIHQRWKEHLYWTFCYSCHFCFGWPFLFVLCVFTQTKDSPFSCFCSWPSLLKILSINCQQMKVRSVQFCISCNALQWKAMKCCTFYCNAQWRKAKRTVHRRKAKCNMHSGDNSNAQHSWEKSNECTVQWRVAHCSWQWISNSIVPTRITSYIRNT